MTGPSTTAGGFVPPVYPFDKLGEYHELAARHRGGAVDLSIGTPCDPPPLMVLEALGSSGTERGYPSSVGSQELREAASQWMKRRLGVEVPASAVAACVGTKELVAGVPQWLRLRSPDRDVVLHPELAYPTYEMGAVLARCRPVAVPVRPDGRMDVAAIREEDAVRALCLWVNSPSNPSGMLEDLDGLAAWGREHDVPVFSDECYVEFTWSGSPRSVLQSGIEGVVAVHSLSKRSNLAGLRVGFIAGDPELVSYLAGVRRHAGFMVAGPVQHAAAVALGDDSHVAAQRELYRERIEYLQRVFAAAGLPVVPPGGAFYLWVAAPRGPDFASGGESPAFELGRKLAASGGVVVSPGDAYGPSGRAHVRLAAVQPLERLRLVGERLAAAPFGPPATAST